MQIYDYLIVGAGFAGSVLAERLNSIGKKVLLIDKKDHIGGHSYDYYDENGVLIHKYGPHYFRTNDDEIVNYLSRFTEWYYHNYKVRVSIKDKLYTFPINITTIDEYFGINLKTEEEMRKFLETKRIKIENPTNAEEQIISQVGIELYEAFFKNYTKKQWDKEPKELDPSIVKRIPIRYNFNDNYLDEKFQAMPKEGYFKLFENMLKGVRVELKTDYKSIRDNVKYKKLIWTGPIDEFFDYKYGKLEYRGLRFEIERYEKEYYQEWGQINYPNEYEYTRIVEIKHVTGQKIKATTIVKEYPVWNDEKFYPVLTIENKEKYSKYFEEAKKLDNVYFIGRLAEYKYLNMDWVVRKALNLFKELSYE